MWEKYYPRQATGTGVPASSSKTTGDPALAVRPLASSIKSNGLDIIILPSDPAILSQTLDLLLASKQAGNTGVRNEAVIICDELKRLGKMKC
jgi:hypothetical protein